MDVTSALLLGVVEGLTEFLPISSTGHLILLSALLGDTTDANKVFTIVIQLGAILAILVLYWQKFLWVLRGIHRKGPAQHFARILTIAVLPAMAIGVLAHDAIKAALFSPIVVAVALILGGIAILLIERFKPAPTIHSTEEMSWQTAVKIGLIQCLAMIPGTSRSGATIMGALMFGVERKAAAEFSFFLAVPTMLAATSYSLYKARHELTGSDLSLMAIGLVTSFLVALLVVRWLVGFVSRHGFTPFAWYRIALGAIILVLVAMSA